MLAWILFCSTILSCRVLAKKKKPKMITIIIIVICPLCPTVFVYPIDGTACCKWRTADGRNSCRKRKHCRECRLAGCTRRRLSAFFCLHPIKKSEEGVSLLQGGVWALSISLSPSLSRSLFFKYCQSGRGARHSSILVHHLHCGLSR